MSQPGTQLTCNFALKGTNLGPDQGLGVVFHSNDGGASYGGVVTIQTPATAGPVVTGLWDSDGNVFFDVVVYANGASQASCTINSGSNPGSFDPLIEVSQQSGLACQIVQTGRDPSTNTYDYDLQITLSSAADFARKRPIKKRPGAPAPVAVLPPQQYTFDVSLLEGTPLGVWQPGTMTLTVNDGEVSGVLTIPGYYHEPVVLSGSASSGTVGTDVRVSGKSSELEGDFAFTYDFDGFLVESTYLGGMASILDYGAQETYLYVFQGYTPSSSAARPRKRRSAV